MMPAVFPGQDMTGFELWLFSTNVALAQQAVAAGVDGIIIDWECRGKPERQRGADTQINRDTVADLVRMRAGTTAPIIVRINSYGGDTAEEVEQAAGGGADEILLPMVETAEEVLRTMDRVRGRMAVGILIETLAAVAQAEQLGRLPVRRVYVGLNDLSIQRGTRNIFLPLTDGTLSAVRGQVQAPFGFGGLTLPECGRPIACRLLMGEMARLQAGFTFLRRSFLRDTAGRDLNLCVADIRAGLAAAAARGPDRVAADHAELAAAVRAMAPG